MKGRRPFTPLGAVHPDPCVWNVPQGGHSKTGFGGTDRRGCQALQYLVPLAQLKGSAKTAELGRRIPRAEPTSLA